MENFTTTATIMVVVWLNW